MAEKRALCLIGDYYHEANRIEEMLGDVFGDSGILADYFYNPLEVPWDKLEEYDLLLIGTEERIEPKVSKKVWNTPEDEEAIRDYVRDGGNLFALHAGLAYQPIGAYFDVVKGCFQFHPSEHPNFTVTPGPDSGDWFDRDISFSIKDEMYFVKVASADTRILMNSVSADYGSSPAAWAHEFGNGRVFAFTPGHSAVVFKTPEYRKVIKKGVSWCVRK